MKADLNPQTPTAPASGTSWKAKSAPNRCTPSNPAVDSLDTMRLDRACAEFEALFIQKLFETMRASIPKSGLMDGGTAETIYTSMLDQQVAQDLALQGSLGLSARIKAQIVQRLQTRNDQGADATHRSAQSNIARD
jgi:Rod binding domain-containing protein